MSITDGIITPLKIIIITTQCQYLDIINCSEMHSSKFWSSANFKVNDRRYYDVHVTKLCKVLSSGAPESSKFWSSAKFKVKDRCYHNVKNHITPKNWQRWSSTKSKVLQLCKSYGAPQSSKPWSSTKSRSSKKFKVLKLHEVQSPGWLQSSKS